MALPRTLVSVLLLLCCVWRAAANPPTAGAMMPTDGEAPVTCADGKLVDKSSLRDGICDCCDGADEEAGTCPNTCRELLQRRLSLLQRVVRLMERLHRSGTAASGGMTQQGISAVAVGAWTAAQIGTLRDAVRVRYEGQQARVDGLRSELHRAHASAMQQQRANGGVHPSVMQRLNALQEAVASASSALEVYQLQNAAEFGVGARYLPLLADGSLVTPPLSDKLSKGGSTTNIAKRYVYQVSPFDNITQAEYLPDEWSRAEAAAKGQAVESVSVTPDGRVMQLPNRTLGEARVIGQWRGYLRLSEVAPALRFLSPAYPGVEPLRELIQSKQAQGRALSREEERAAPRPRTSLLTTAGIMVDNLELMEVALLYTLNDVCVSEDVRTNRKAAVVFVCSATYAAAGGENVTVEEMRWLLGKVRPDLPDAAIPRYLPGSSPFMAPAAGSGSGSAADLATRATIVHMAEDGICGYVFTIAHPLACSAKDLRSAKALRDAVKARVDQEEP